MITPKFKIWLRAAIIRAVRTIAQALLASLGAAATFSDVDWKVVISTSLFAGFLSLITSIVTGLPEADAEDEARKLEEARKLNGQDN